MRKIENVIFDASGVLIDDIYTVWKADSDAYKDYGFQQPPFPPPP